MNPRLATLLSLPVVISALACGLDPADSGADSGLDTNEECVTVEADGCACGWSKARTSGMLFGVFTVDGLSQVTNFESSNTYDGTPAACIRDDRRAGQWYFDVGGEPYGILTVGATTDGDYLTDDAAATVTIDLFGHSTPTVFTGSSFTNGQLTYTTGNLNIDGVLQGNAISSDGVGLQINVTAEGSL